MIFLWWASIPKVVGSIPTVSGIFFKLARCGYTLRVTSQAFYCINYAFTLAYLQKLEECLAIVNIKYFSNINDL
jgi:hypothetical protein